MHAYATKSSPQASRYDIRSAAELFSRILLLLTEHFLNSFLNAFETNLLIINHKTALIPFFSSGRERERKNNKTLSSYIIFGLCP